MNIPKDFIKTSISKPSLGSKNSDNLFINSKDPNNKNKKEKKERIKNQNEYENMQKNRNEDEQSGKSDSDYRPGSTSKQIPDEKSSRNFLVSDDQNMECKNIPPLMTPFNGLLKPPESEDSSQKQEILGGIQESEDENSSGYIPQRPEWNQQDREFLDQMKTVNRNSNRGSFPNRPFMGRDSFPQRRGFQISFPEVNRRMAQDESHLLPSNGFEDFQNFKNPNTFISPLERASFGFESRWEQGAGGRIRYGPEHDFILRSEESEFGKFNSRNCGMMGNGGGFQHQEDRGPLGLQRPLAGEIPLNPVQRRGTLLERPDLRDTENGYNFQNMMRMHPRHQKNNLRRRRSGRGQGPGEEKIGEFRNKRIGPITKRSEGIGEGDGLRDFGSNEILSGKLTGSKRVSKKKVVWSKLQKEEERRNQKEAFCEDYILEKKKQYFRLKRTLQIKDVKIHNLIRQKKKVKKQMQEVKRFLREHEKKHRFPLDYYASKSSLFEDKNMVIKFDIQFLLGQNDVDVLKNVDLELGKRTFITKCSGDCSKRIKEELARVGKQQKIVLKSNRIPYVLGGAEDYVLVKFNREKKREKAKFSEKAKMIFKRLKNVLKKILWNEEIFQNELDALNVNEQNIIYAVVLKKKLIRKNEKIKFIAKNFNNIIQDQGQKRNEENLKCIFKYAQKFLRTQFRKKHQDFKYRKSDVHLKQKNLIDLGFYTYYFGEIADKKDWPISKFFHPKVFAGGKAASDELEKPEERPKTINREYIENLKRSSMFMKDMSDFLDNKYKLEGEKLTGIIDQYKSISEEKLMQKLEQWYKLLKTLGDIKGQEMIMADLVKNDKCKLPWSIKEINRAVKDTKNHFELGQ